MKMKNFLMLVLIHLITSNTAWTQAFNIIPAPGHLEIFPEHLSSNLPLQLSP